VAAPRWRAQRRQPAALRRSSSTPPSGCACLPPRYVGARAAIAPAELPVRYLNAVTAALLMLVFVRVLPLAMALVVPSVSWGTLVVVLSGGLTFFTTSRFITSASVRLGPSCLVQIQFAAIWGPGTVQLHFKLFDPFTMGGELSLRPLQNARLCQICSLELYMRSNSN